MASRYGRGCRARSAPPGGVTSEHALARRLRRSAGMSTSTGNTSVFSVAREVLRNGSGDSSFAVSHRYVILCTRFTLASGATSASMDRVRYPVSRPLGNSNSIFQGGAFDEREFEARVETRAAGRVPGGPSPGKSGGGSRWEGCFVSLRKSHAACSVATRQGVVRARVWRVLRVGHELSSSGCRVFGPCDALAESGSCPCVHRPMHDYKVRPGERRGGQVRSDAERLPARGTLRRV